MTQTVRDVLACVAAAGCIALGAWEKLKGHGGGDALIATGTLILGGVAALHGALDKVAANKDTAEGIVGMVAKVLDAVAPQFKGVVDPASQTIDDVIEDLVKAKAQAAAISAGGAATPSAAPKSPIGS